MKWRQKHRGLRDSPLWYKDAVIYELHVRAFYDSNDDGIGDFPGLIKKLDYLEDLGVTAIWLLPFYPSPLRDDGYDIADYMSVNPIYGNLADFRRFLRESHRRGMRVITELVLNHTSNQHPWFQRARHAPPGSRERNFYVWSDTPKRYQDARIIFRDFETSNWTWDPVANAYYWHRFYSHQPDLNFASRAVQNAVIKVLDFWMGMGVDGMRLDAVPYLFEAEGTNCENLPATHAVLKRLRAHIDSKYSNRVFLAEANQWPEDAAAYFGNGDECHMNFHFPLMPRLFMGLHLEDSFPVLDILEQTPDIPETCQWATFLRNHDELTLEMVTDEDRDTMWRVYAEDAQARINLGIRRRLTPLLKNQRKVELMKALLFSLPGTPVLYYGDEIGMGDNIYLGDRHGVRTPFQWSADRNGGFSAANPQKLYLPIIIDPEHHYQSVNVENQQANPTSLLAWTKSVIRMRNAHKAFGRGSLEVVPSDNKRVLSFIRAYKKERILVVANLSRYPQCARLVLHDDLGSTPVELFGRVDFPPIGDDDYFLSLGPYGFYWFLLREPETAHERSSESLAELIVAQKWEEVFYLDGLSHALTPFLMGQRWFRSKSRRIRATHINDVIPLNEQNTAFLVIDVEFFEGEPEAYLVPLAVMRAFDGTSVNGTAPAGLVAYVMRSGDDEKALLCDAFLKPEFPHVLLEAVLRGRRLKGAGSELSSSILRGAWAARPLSEMPAKVGELEQSNTSIIYGDELILKLIRRLDAGLNPDVEVTRFLAEKTSYAHAPTLVGATQFKRGKGEPGQCATLQRFVPNQGDAWKLALEFIDRYFERVEPVDPATVEEFFPGETSLAYYADHEPPEQVQTWVGTFLTLCRLLGERTAELHLALSSRKDIRDFAPEPFSELHQRSLYQSARATLKTTMQTLEERRTKLSANERSLADLVIRDSRVLEKGIRAITKGKLDALRIRVHGDFHLGQVLFTGSDFVIIDFEGEPSRNLNERRFLRSPMRDVAGMLRSFHYAAVGALRTRASTTFDRSRLRPFAHLWATWVSRVYLGTYLKGVQNSQLLPSHEADRERLVQYYLIEKCVYELAYELNNRPAWVSLPLSGLESLIAGYTDAKTEEA